VRGAIVGRYVGIADSATYELDERVSYVVVLVIDEPLGPSVVVRIVVDVEAMLLATAVGQVMICSSVPLTSTNTTHIHRNDKTNTIGLHPFAI